jgi:hypothetical protein
LASTGRRRFLRGAAAAPLLCLARPAAVLATEYSSASEVLDTIDRREVEVAGRLAVIARATAGAQAFAGSVASDQARHRADRDKLRRRLKLPASSAPAPAPAAKPDLSLAALREAQQQLVHAHAEGLPALGDAGAVAVLARHMVDASRQLTVIDLWIEAEELRG